MGILIAIPILIILVILQSAIVSLVPLLHGIADIVLLAILAWAVQDRVTTAWYWCAIGGLLISIASALPIGVALAGYFLASLGLAGPTSGNAHRHLLWNHNHSRSRDFHIEFFR